VDSEHLFPGHLQLPLLAMASPPSMIAPKQEHLIPSHASNVTSKGPMQVCSFDPTRNVVKQIVKDLNAEDHRPVVARHQHVVIEVAASDTLIMRIDGVAIVDEPATARPPVVAPVTMHPLAPVANPPIGEPTAVKNTPPLASTRHSVTENIQLDDHLSEHQARETLAPLKVTIARHPRKTTSISLPAVASTSIAPRNKRLPSTVNVAPSTQATSSRTASTPSLAPKHRQTSSAPSVSSDLFGASFIHVMSSHPP
jgi:hypothetical protein